MDEQIPKAPLDRPLREGANQPHEVFRTRLCSSLDTFSTFLDYGSPASYISRKLAARLQPYSSRKPSTLSGIGGSGPTIDEDVVVRFAWKLPKGWSLPYEVSVGLVDDDSFPGDLTLGKSVFHKIGLSFLEDGAVQLKSHPGTPVLVPYKSKTITFATEQRVMSTSEEVIAQLDNVDAKYHNIIASWNEQFPGVFDPARRNTAEKATVMHRIDTGDSSPIRQAPRRYSPAQGEAMRELCSTHIGSIIRKSKSSWCSQALLTPKKKADGTPKMKWNAKNKKMEVVWRFCCDFRRLNEVTKKHAHPLPNANAEIERAAGYRY